MLIKVLFEFDRRKKSNLFQYKLERRGGTYKVSHKYIWFTSALLVLVLIVMSIWLAIFRNEINNSEKQKSQQCLWISHEVLTVPPFQEREKV